MFCFFLIIFQALDLEVAFLECLELLGWWEWQVDPGTLGPKGSVCCEMCYISGQIIATSHDLTPNGGLVREIPLFQGNLGWWNIIIWPDISPENERMSPENQWLEDVFPIQLVPF